MNATEKMILDRFKEQVAGRLPLHAMILFGSRARGDADPDSDMDVLVVLEDSAPDHAATVVSECAWEAGFEHGIVVVPVTYMRKEWEEGPERYSLLAIAVRTDGVAV
jgi:UTP:GlnB (protein PII) uridylyltransferase